MIIMEEMIIHMKKVAAVYNEIIEKLNIQVFKLT